MAITTYTFTAENGGVLITNTLGYRGYWQGFTNIMATSIDVITGQPSIVFHNTQNGTLSIPFNQIGTIGGDTPSATLAGVMAQLNELFNTAYKENGGGDSSTITTLVFKVGTPDELANVPYTATVANGNTISNAALSSQPLAVVIGNVFSQPVTSTGYVWSTGVLDFTASGGVADVNVYVIISS